MKSTVTLLLLALAAPGVYAAEDIYRSVMPDGKVLYGESPTPGAKSVQKLRTTPASTGVTVVTPGEMNRAPSSPQTGGVAVIPQEQRPPSPGPASSGSSVSPSGLPTRAY